MKKVLLVFAALIVACAGCSDSKAKPKEESATDTAAPKLDHVTLLLNWFPEAEHGGYYAAQVNGYYREAGLDVTIMPGGSGTPVLPAVAGEKVDFGISNADYILFAKQQQAPIVAVMAPLQNSPRCLLVHRESGITSFADLRDMTIAVTPGSAFVEFLKHEVPLENVQFVPYSNIQPFFRDPRLAQQGYVFSEPFVARQKGVDPTVLMLSDLGFNTYTSVLVANTNLVDKQPDVVRRMVEASVRGWREYLRDPEPTNQRIHELNPEIDMEALQYGAEAVAPLVVTEAAHTEGLGSMTFERWRTLEEQLIATGQLPAGTAIARDVFSDKFLPKAPHD